jgi:ribosomal RNA-processing protein 36
MKHRSLEELQRRADLEDGDEGTATEEEPEYEAHETAAASGGGRAPRGEAAAAGRRAAAAAAAATESEDDHSEGSDDYSAGSESDGDEASASGSEGDEPEAGGADADADVPIGELLARKLDGGAAGPRARAQRRPAGAAAAADFRRENKKRPAEMSSKRPVGVVRDALQAGRREARDPRFDSLTAGRHDEAAFKKRYAFLYEETLPAERRALQAELKKARGAGARAALQARLSRVAQSLKDEERRQRAAAADAALRARERAAVAGGKRPFHLKASEKKKAALVARYEELREGGGLEKFMEKRRRKNAAKDHRYVPSGRRDE